MPKAEEPALLHRIDGALGALELARGGERGTTGIVPLIESALGVLSTYELCRSSPRVRSVLFGSGEEGDLVVDLVADLVGDLVADLGCQWTPEGTGMLTARATVLMAARAGRGRRADGGGVHDCPEPLQAVHAVDALVHALDVPVTVRSLAYRHRALLAVGQEAVVKARAQSLSDDGRRATFEVWMERAGDGERTTTVTATVELASWAGAAR